MNVHELHECIARLDAAGYCSDNVKEGLSMATILWAFPTPTGVELKSALSFTADDLKKYTEEYYVAGLSPYNNDEEFAAHLMEVGIQQDTVREALGEAWNHLFLKIMMKYVNQNNVKEESK